MSLLHNGSLTTVTI